MATTPTFVGNTPPVAGTTSLTLGYPSTPAAAASGDIIILLVGTDGSAIGTPSANTWTSLGSTQTGGGMSVHGWYLTATGTESGTLSVACTGGTKSVGTMMSYHPSTGGDVITPIGTSGSDTDTTSTAVSVTGGSITSQNADLLVSWTTILAAASGTFSAAATGLSLVQSGATMGTNTPRFGTRTATNTVYYNAYDRVITTGGTGAPTFAMTAVGANAAGSGVFMLLREAAAAVLPVAAFSQIQYGLDGNFTDISTWTAPATGISSWAWNFGDSGSGGSNTSTLQNPIHTFSAAGTYTITLTVTDNNGSTSTPVTHNLTLTAPGTSNTVVAVTSSTGWTPTSGTVLSVLSDTSGGSPVLTSFAASPNNPSASELDTQLGALAPAATNQPLVVTIFADRVSSTSGSLAAQIYEGATLRSSLTGIAIPDMTATGGTGTATSGTISTSAVVELVFPWTDVQNIVDWNQLTLKLQVTAS